MTDERLQVRYVPLDDPRPLGSQPQEARPRPAGDRASGSTASRTRRSSSRRSTAAGAGSSKATAGPRCCGRCRRPGRNHRAGSEWTTRVPGPPRCCSVSMRPSRAEAEAYGVDHNALTLGGSGFGFEDLVQLFDEEGSRRCSAGHPRCRRASGQPGPGRRGRPPLQARTSSPPEPRTSPGWTRRRRSSARSAARRSRDEGRPPPRLLLPRGGQVRSHAVALLPPRCPSPSWSGSACGRTRSSGERSSMASERTATSPGRSVSKTRRSASWSASPSPRAGTTRPRSAWRSRSSSSAASLPA